MSSDNKFGGPGKSCTYKCILKDLDDVLLANINKAHIKKKPTVTLSNSTRWQEKLGMQILTGHSTRCILVWKEKYFNLFQYISLLAGDKFYDVLIFRVDSA